MFFVQAAVACSAGSEVRVHRLGHMGAGTEDLTEGCLLPFLCLSAAASGWDRHMCLGPRPSLPNFCFVNCFSDPEAFKQRPGKTTFASTI